MELSIIILHQTLTMALYMLIGFLLFKGGKITAEGSKAVAGLLLWMVIPSTIINSFCVEFSSKKLLQFAVSFLIGLVIVLLSIIVSRFFFKNSPVDLFASSFSNAGFIGIPLIQASLGTEAVFYLVGMIILLNLFQWTYGASAIKGAKNRITLREAVLNPVTIASIAGFLLFLSGSGNRLPEIIDNCIDGVAALNAPLAMIVLGVYLAQTDLITLVTTKRLYLTSLVRLCVIPLLSIFLLAFLPVESTIKMTLLIAASAPAGANTAVYSQIYDADYKYACKTVTQSTILSIITLPVIIAISRFFI